MKFSENWLREQVHVDATSEQLQHSLTMIGLEVEGSERIGDGLGGVIVARIVSCARHPEADRLQVCQVDAGDAGQLQVVCGAPNARPGLLAPLATAGATVGGTVIRAARLRGVESNGMLCSAKELGIDADAAGLMELPQDAPVGAPLADYLGLPDTIIELGLTPNRADCFGVRGIARDVAAAFDGKLTAADVPAVAPACDDSIAVRLDAGADAPRFAGRVIRGVDATVPTPVWMAERLRRSGVRPVGLPVDVTQYVMLELGQPMHAYDRDLLHGPFAVRHARDGESLALLNGDVARLDAGFLVITDADRAVGVAGIMGGDDTKVGAGTRNVFLEAAHFAPAAIIGRSRRLGLHTDAGHRFERGVDPTLPPVAIEYATRLILDIAGGTPGPLVDTVRDADLPAAASVTLRRARLARVLGAKVADADVERILRALDFDVQPTDGGWQVTVPPRRFDIAIEEDLIEEVARIHGYDAIPTTLPGGATRLAPVTETRSSQHDVRRQLVARDYLEAINFAFVDAAVLEQWQMAQGSVTLANPLSAELAVMRTSLLPGLVAATARNLARQQSRVRLFEIGTVFATHRRDPADTAEPAAGAPGETLRVAGVATGSALPEGWGDAERRVDFHDIKGDLASLAGLPAAQLQFVPSAPAHAHPGRSADIHRDGRKIGWIGQLHPRLQQALGIDADVLAFELDLVPLLQRQLPRARPLSRYPSVRRDLAFVLADDTPWGEVERVVREAAGPLLREVRLFDRYAGKGVEDGRKSLAMALILQEESRTLQDRDVDAVVAAVVAALAARLGATIRA